MVVWIDGDSVPRDVQSLLTRRAERDVAASKENLITDQSSAAPTIRFVCSKKLTLVPERLCEFVSPGPGAVDSFIESRSKGGDVVVTRDIPLAERLAARGIAVINDRGAAFSKNNVAQRRSERDASLELRNLGLLPPSPKGNTRAARDTKAFADSLDRILTSLAKAAGRP